jgi:hypothetical protein
MYATRNNVYQLACLTFAKAKGNGWWNCRPLFPEQGQYALLENALNLRRDQIRRLDSESAGREYKAGNGVAAIFELTE